MQTDRLIEELTKKADPVKRLRSPWRRCIYWLGMTFICLVAVLTFIGVRPDLSDKCTEAPFLIQGILTLAVAVLSAAGAFALSVPSERKTTFAGIAPVAALVAWILYLLVSLAISSRADMSPGIGVTCVREIVILALPPVVIMFFMIYRAAPLKTRWTGVLIFLSVAAFGALGTQMVCRSEDLLHILLWHLVPVLLIGCLGVLLGRWLRRWERR